MVMHVTHTQTQSQGLKVIIPFFILSVNPQVLSSCVKYYGVTYHKILYGHACNTHKISLSLSLYAWFCI